MVSILVNVADNVGVTRVEIDVDGLLKATSATAPFTTQWNIHAATVGSHVVRVKAYDLAGNSAWSAPVTVRK